MGRIDDVLNVAGHRLGTAEVESALVSHPAVAEAAVVGRPDELKGQAVVCFVTLKDGDQATGRELRDELKKHVRTVDRPRRHAGRDPLHRGAAEDALGQNHAPPAQADRRGRSGHRRHHDARRLHHPREARRDCGRLAWNISRRALREARRSVERLLGRWRLRGARKELAKAETELGLLGWQQAEYDAETQREVDKIKNTEREQARLTNEGADLARTLQELSAQRAAAQKEFDEKRGAEEKELLEMRQHIATAEAQLPAAKEQLAAIQRWMARLENEQREASRLYDDLLQAEPQTAEVRLEATRLRDRVQALPHELAEGQKKLTRAESDLTTLQQMREREAAEETVLLRELRRADSAHDSQDRGLAPRSRPRSARKRASSVRSMRSNMRRPARTRKSGVSLPITTSLP